jgi:hypothetical protein
MPVIEDVALRAPAAQPDPGDTAQLARDWPGILGLALDRASGAVRMAR